MKTRYRYRRSRPRPHPRTITVKYAGKCACCGAEIKAGEIADYFPPGIIASLPKGAIAHTGALDGNSARCSLEIRERMIDSATNDFAGDGLDQRHEDQCADICGLS